MRPKDTVTEIKYSLYGVAHYSIYKNGREWCVVQQCGGALSNVRMMDHSKAGGRFSAFYDAERELRRIFDNMLAPLGRKEIVSHFSMKWMRREEDSRLLIAFRKHLLSGDTSRAAKVYKKFSSWTREAIPEKVVLHLVKTGAH